MRGTLQDLCDLQIARARGLGTGDRIWRGVTESLGLVPSKIRIPESEYASVPAHARIRVRQRLSSIRLWPLDPRRGNLQVQGAMGRRTGAALLALHLPRRQVAGPGKLRNGKV